MSKYHWLIIVATIVITGEIVSACLLGQYVQNESQYLALILGAFSLIVGTSAFLIHTHDQLEKQKDN